MMMYTLYNAVTLSSLVLHVSLHNLIFSYMQKEYDHGQFVKVKEFMFKILDQKSREYHIDSKGRNTNLTMMIDGEISTTNDPPSYHIK